MTKTVLHALEKGLVADPDASGNRIAGTRQERVEQPVGDPERRCWEGALIALEEGDDQRLLRETLEMARWVDGMDHLSSARELYRVAHWVAVLVGAAPDALEAARAGLGICRRRSDDGAAGAWHGAVEALAPPVEGTR